MQKSSFWDIFQQNSQLFANKTCFIDGNEETIKYFTYEDVFDASKSIFNKFNSYFERGEVIGVLLKHEVSLIATIAMIHRIKCSFIFLDQDKKLEEQKDILKTLQICHILSYSNANWDYFEEVEKFNSLDSKTISLYRSKNIVSRKYCDGFSYFIQTSGSTSEPKYVAVTHNSILPNIIDFQKMIGVSSDDIILFSTPLTFDPSVVEIYLAAMCGASLLSIQPKFLITNPTLPVKPTIVQTTPSKFHLNDEECIKSVILSADSNLRALILGGEPFLCFDKLKRIKHPKNLTKVFNVYGITEVSCWASIEEIDFSRDSYEPTVGYALGETILKIEKINDEDASGFILIGSASRKCKVDHEIFQNKDDSENSEIAWRNTGDIGMEMADKRIKFFGRKDHIIKKLGHKVNLTKIEASSREIELVDQCVCLWIADEQKIIILFTSKSKNLKSPMEKELFSKLKDYELPDNIYQVDFLPLNKHGKISYPRAVELYKEYSSFVREPKDKFYKSLTTLLKIPKESNNEIDSLSFFDLGGNSILAIQFTNSLLHQRDPTFFQILKMLLNKNDSLRKIYECYKQKTKFIVDDLRYKRNNSEESSSDKNCKKIKTERKYDIVIEWRYNLGKCIDASPTSFEVNGTMFIAIGSHSGTFVILDALTGDLKFNLECNTRIECTVLAFDDESNHKFLCFGGYDGTVWCLSAETYAIIWKKQLESKVKSKPCFYKSKIYIGAYDSCLYCICCKTGEILYKTQIGKSGISADLLVSDCGNILVAALNGALACIDDHTFTSKWEITFPSPIFANPVPDHRGNVIAVEVKGILHCVNIITGTEIWKYENPEGLIFSTPLVCEIEQHRYICFGSHNNHYYILRDGGLNAPVERNRINLRDKIYADPCLIRETETVCVTAAGTVTIVNTKLATTLGDASLPGEAFSSPVAVGNRVYVGCRDDHVYCIKISKTDK